MYNLILNIYYSVNILTSTLYISGIFNVLLYINLFLYIHTYYRKIYVNIASKVQHILKINDLCNTHV